MLGIQVLPVSEIENFLLLPAVSRAILEMNDIDGAKLEEKLSNLKAAIIADASDPKNASEVVLGYVVGVSTGCLSKLIYLRTSRSRI